MVRCSAIKSNGQRCERIVSGSESYCYSHDPDRARERSTNASKAARTKNGTALTEIKDALRTLADDVISGNVERGRAAVAGQLYGVLLKAIEQERKLKEVEELEERLSLLEQAQPRSPGGSTWGR